MNQYQLLQGDCREVLKTLPANSVDAIVTDPPYGLEFMGKEWDAPWKQGGAGFSDAGIGDRAIPWPSFTSTSRLGSVNPTCECGGRLRGKKKCSCETPKWKEIGKRRNPENEGLPSDVTSAGMSKQMLAFQEWFTEVAVEAYRVLKPGGHILSFGGSRTYHRMACAIEDAGFEVRDQIMWVYGSGFPKSHNISKALDKNGIETKQWDGWGTALKPAHEPICLARKPLEGTVVDNIRKWGVGGLNIDGCRVETDSAFDDPRLGGKGTWKSDKMAANVYGKYEGKDVSSSNLGRFPANLIHDGHQQVLDLFPREAGASAPVKAGYSGDAKNGIYHDYAQRGDDGATFYSDKGSAARFFYCPKASKSDREEGCDDLPTQEKPAHMRTADGTGEASMTDGFQPTQRKNIHPTVKPTELMRYLVRLITPPNGVVLDPFNGSGSTGKAAMLEGMQYIGIEMNPEYIKIAEARISNALNQ
jgi:site-specific DNA-methyltransferase (adenine-specific)